MELGHVMCIEVYIIICHLKVYIIGLSLVIRITFIYCHPAFINIYSNAIQLAWCQHSYTVCKHLPCH